jgi:2-(1,2-epoxy-1,2-dihydrophenyl)acetyl-CoA isomerase
MGLARQDEKSNDLSNPQSAQSPGTFHRAARRMTDSDDAVLTRIEDRVGYITINRPSTLNAIDAAVAEGLLSACKHLAAKRDVRVIVIRGEGKAFSAGGDLHMLRRSPLSAAESLIGPMHSAVSLIADLPIPVIASVHGVAAGAGFSLAMACDLAIAAEGTRFNLAYLNVGASCDVGASWYLPRLVGLRQAMAIAFLNETLNANDALKLGLVNRMVPAADLEAETNALAGNLATKSPVAVGHLKRLLRISIAHELKGQLVAEAEAFKACALTNEFSEAISAFFDKPTPVPNGN